MAQISSDPVDIKRAFRRHRSTFELVGLSRRPRLVSLFYAAECGLKYLVMMSESLTSTGDLRNSLTAVLGIPKKDVDLHNIEQLCLAANMLPVDVGTAPTTFQLNGESFAPYKIHEAARYGVRIADPYLRSVEQWLERVVAAIEARMIAQGI